MWRGFAAEDRQVDKFCRARNRPGGYSGENELQNLRWCVASRRRRKGKAALVLLGRVPARGRISDPACCLDAIPQCACPQLRERGLGDISPVRIARATWWRWRGSGVDKAPMTTFVGSRGRRWVAGRWRFVVKRLVCSRPYSLRRGDLRISIVLTGRSG